MSSSQHRGDDDIAFFQADIGETRLLAAISGSATQLPTAGGALPPGRYLIQATDISDAGALVWVGVGAFGTTISLTAAAGHRRIPLSSGAILAIETNVRKGDSDQIAVRTSAGTANVFISLVSTVAK